MTAAVLAVVFVAGRVIGDPVRIVVGLEASEERIQAIRDALRLNEPLVDQLVGFFASAARGEFGESFWQKTPALPLVISRLPATLYLAAVALLIAVPTAIVLGALAALRPGSRIDRLINVVSLAGVSIVEFWLGLMLILLIAVRLDWFPTSGYGGIEYVLLPAATLAFKPLGRISQISRSAMLDELAKPYVKAARAKGLTERQIVYTRALRNAAIPILTVSGDELSGLLNGAIVVETVFAWPGIGLLTVQAMERRDLPLIEATVFVVAIMVIVTNLVIDFAYAYFNPRVRFD